MKYTYSDSINLAVEPIEWDKNSPKEILQFALGGLLYMPGTNDKIVQDIKNKRFPHLTSLVLDLEDALGDDVVKQGERSIKVTLDELQMAVARKEIKLKDIPLIFVRVREQGQMKRLFKGCGIRRFSMLTGFVLPKFDKTNCFSYVDEFKTIVAELDTPLYVMPIIESRNVMYREVRMENIMTINEALKGIVDHVLNVRVGATDFSNIYGMRRSVDTMIYEVGLVSDCLIDVLNVFARNYICSAPVWEYFGKEPGAWSEGLTRELRHDKLMGFIGKTCIHPTQLPYIQENYIVDYEEYQDSLNILGMSTGLVGVKKGYGDNKMNEVKAHTNWAKKIISRAQVFGVAAEKRVPLDV